MAKSGADSYVPDLILVTSRINIFVLCYMYHSGASFINLWWLVGSFIFKRSDVFFLSSFCQLPLLIWMYLFIYATDLPVICDSWMI